MLTVCEQISPICSPKREMIHYKMSNLHFHVLTVQLRALLQCSSGEL